jgi:tRNA threonylcarbamoyladenosine modification (KEOPS) complex  Pcc1 subunit
MQRVTAEGAGFTISGVTVPSLDDYTRLVTNVQQIANDVAALRATVNALINQLKG